jgi:dUTP pyrophosphatase
VEALSRAFMEQPPSAVVGQSPPLMVRLLSADATAPRRGSALAAGYDLFSAEEASVAKRGRAVVRTDVAIALPPGVYGRVGA